MSAKDKNEYDTGTPEEIVNGMVKAVEYAAALEEGRVVVGLKHGRDVDLAPVLLTLYANGVCVRSLTANRREFVIELRKAEGKEMERAGKDYASLAIDEALSRQKKRSTLH
jgi:hypothetical protein